MYKISDFSKITNLSVKALRYYDEEKILVPSHRDSETAYRYYSEDDFKKAQIVGLLRSLDFSIAEIRDVMNGCGDLTDLPFYLEEKKKIIEDRIHREKALVKKLNLYIKPKDREEVNMSYEIEEKEIDTVTVASIRYRGKYNEVGKHIGKLYKAVRDHAAGPPIQCYHDAEYVEGDAELELCIPTKRPVSHPDILMKKLPAVRAVCTTHTGSYEGLNLAYKALLDYANVNHISYITPSREIYIKGPGLLFKGNEDSYITEIIMPYKEL